MKKHLLHKFAATLLVFAACMSVASLFAPQIVEAADPVCAVLDKGQTACPDKFPGAAGKCYFYDPGNPNAGNAKGFPGWQETGCSSDIFKEASCVPGKNPQPAQCQHIGETQDPALACKQDCDLVSKYLDPLINVLAAIVGVVVVISIIVGGIQYTTSGDDPQKVSQAKKRIVNALIALVAFFFLYAFLQWIMPGGFLNS